MNLYHTFQHIKNESTIEEALEACREEYSKLSEEDREKELAPIIDWVITQIRGEKKPPIRRFQYPANFESFKITYGIDENGNDYFELAEGKYEILKWDDSVTHLIVGKDKFRGWDSKDIRSIKLIHL